MENQMDDMAQIYGLGTEQYWPTVQPMNTPASGQVGGGLTDRFSSWLSQPENRLTMYQLAGAISPKDTFGDRLSQAMIPGEKGRIAQGNLDKKMQDYLRFSKLLADQNVAGVTEKPDGTLSVKATPQTELRQAQLMQAQQQGSIAPMAPQVQGVAQSQAPGQTGPQRYPIPAPLSLEKRQQLQQLNTNLSQALGEQGPTPSPGTSSSASVAGQMNPQTGMPPMIAKRLAGGGFALYPMSQNGQMMDEATVFKLAEAGQLQPLGVYKTEAEALNALEGKQPKTEYGPINTMLTDARWTGGRISQSSGWYSTPTGFPTSAPNVIAGPAQTTQMRPMPNFPLSSVMSPGLSPEEVLAVDTSARAAASAPFTIAHQYAQAQHASEQARQLGAQGLIPVEVEPGKPPVMMTPSQLVQHKNNLYDRETGLAQATMMAGYRNDQIRAMEPYRNAQTESTTALGDERRAKAKQLQDIEEIVASKGNQKVPGSDLTYKEAHRLGVLDDLMKQSHAIGLAHDKQTAAQKKAVYDSYTTRVKEYQRLGPMFQPKYPGETPDARAKQELESSLPGSTRIIEEFVGGPKQGETVSVYPPGYVPRTLMDGRKVMYNPDVEPNKQIIPVK
jgi:hypothetical protein